MQPSICSKENINMQKKEEDIQGTTIIVGLGCAVMLGFIVGVLMCLICSIL